MASDYYGRTTAPGSTAFANDDDRRNEAKAKAALEDAWGVRLEPFAASFAELDWYVVKAGRIEGHAELKSRSHASDAFKSVYLNYRKWDALIRAFIYTGKTSIFVVQFTDEIRWIDVAWIDARPLEVAGCKRLVKAVSDREPVIHVPVAEMKTLKRRTDP